MLYNTTELKVLLALYSGPEMKETKGSKNKRFPRPSQKVLEKAKIGTYSGRKLEPIPEDLDSGTLDKLTSAFRSLLPTTLTTQELLPQNRFQRLENIRFQRLSVSSRPDTPAHKQADALFPQFKKFLQHADPDFTLRELQKLLEKHPSLSIHDVKEMSRALKLSWTDVLKVLSEYRSCYPPEGSKVIAKSPSSKFKKMSPKKREELEKVSREISEVQKDLKVIAEIGEPLDEIFTSDVLESKSLKKFIKDLSHSKQERDRISASTTVSKIDATVKNQLLAKSPFQNHVFIPLILSLVALSFLLYTRVTSCMEEPSNTSFFSYFNETPKTFTECLLSS